MKVHIMSKGRPSCKHLPLFSFLLLLTVFCPACSSDKAQIITLQQQLATVQAELAALKTDLATLKQTTASKKDSSSICDRVQELAMDIAESDILQGEAWGVEQYRLLQRMRALKYELEQINPDVGRELFARLEAAWLYGHRLHETNDWHYRSKGSEVREDAKNLCREKIAPLVSK